jgi:hypothetical protein
MELSLEDELIAAAKAGNVAEVEALIVQGVDIEYRDPNYVSSSL